MIDLKAWPKNLARVTAALLALVVLASAYACAGPKSIDMDVTGSALTQHGETSLSDHRLPQVDEETLRAISQLDGVPDDGSETPPPVMSHGEDYERVRSKNKDVAGWISVPNTRIEYPVVRAADNEYYLTHDIEKNASKSGAVFMDFRNTDPETAKHILIYGHNMRNGSMFHDLNSYKIRDFFDNNRDITLILGDKTVKYEIYAAFVIAADLNFMETRFDDDATFLTYMNVLKDMSKFSAKPSVKLNENDQILTLVTCTYEYDDSRFAVQARRVS